VSDSDAIQHPEGRRTDEKKSGYKVIDRVDKAGKYVCEICHTEGGVQEHEFVEGEEFPPLHELRQGHFLEEGGRVEDLTSLSGSRTGE